VLDSVADQLGCGLKTKSARAIDVCKRLHLAFLGNRDMVVKRLADRGTSAAGALTPRQREVVSLIAAGRTMKEAASVLGLSPRTVETDKYQIMAALGLQTTAELIRYAIQQGFAGPTDRV
jgi:DNA-binding NarL/FixJ family response regulator